MRSKGRQPGRAANAALASAAPLQAPSPLHQILLNTLERSEAHAELADVVADWPKDLYGVTPPGLPYSGWQVLEHMRRTQNDILVFVRDADYVAPAWPRAYWPDQAAPARAADWQQCLSDYIADRKELLEWLKNGTIALEHPVGPRPKGGRRGDAPAPTFLRELLLTLDHGAYHLGQLVLIRRLLGIWPPRPA